MEAQKCSICKLIPEDILMLSCAHDICLDCASSLLITKKQQHNIQCNICGIFTQLDQQTLDQLRKHNTLPYFPVPHHKEKDFTPSLKYPTQQNLNFKPRQSSHNKSIIQNCVDHPQQQILYFCFDCMCQCICPECVIHGKHKNHEVKTIKKSGPIIKRKLQDKLKELEENTNKIKQLKEQLQQKTSDFVEQNKRVKDQIQQVFNVRFFEQDIRSKINMKEKEMFIKCDKVLEITLEELNEKKRQMQMSIQDFRDKTAEIRDYFRRDDLQMLNYFSKNNNKIFKISDQQINFQTQIEQINMNNSQFLIKLNQIGNLILSIDIFRTIAQPKHLKKKYQFEEYSQNKIPYLKNK